MVQLKFNKLRQKTWGICKLSDLRGNFPPHFHEYYGIGMLLSGKREFRIGGESREIEKFQPVIINPGDVHSCRHIGSQPCAWIVCTLSKSLMRIFLKFNDFPFFANWQDEKNNQMLADLLLRLAFFPNENQEMRLEKIFPALQPGSANRRNPLKNALHLSSLDAWPGLDALGKSVGKNKYSFLRQFHSSVKLTPHRFFDALRLSRASMLLANGANPAQCAHESGYCDQSHLNRHFVRYFGYTPRLFQQACQALKKACN